MQDFLARGLVEVLDVRNLQRTYRLDSGCQHGVGLTGAAPPRQVSPGLPQRSKNLRTVEPLPRTVFTESHRRSRLVRQICLANINPGTLVP